MYKRRPYSRQTVGNVDILSAINFVLRRFLCLV